MQAKPETMSDDILFLVVVATDYAKQHLALTFFCVFVFFINSCAPEGCPLGQDHSNSEVVSHNCIIMASLTNVRRVNGRCCGVNKW